VDLKSDRARVQAAILIYLLFCVAMNLGVWAWFALHIHGPHIFPLGGYRDRFSDLLLYSGKYQIWKDPHMGNYDNLNGTLCPRNYPPFAVMVYRFLLQVCAPYALPVMLVTMLGAMAVACTLLWRRVRRFESYRWYMGAAIFLSGFFGWGILQVVMRGNPEGLVWIAVCLGAMFFARRQYPGAAVAFGIASSIKPFPVLWFALMARHRRYREAVLGLVTAAGVTLASLLIIDRNPLRAWRQISGKNTFFTDYVVAFRPMGEMTADHSLFQSMKPSPVSCAIMDSTSLTRNTGCIPTIRSPGSCIWRTCRSPRSSRWSCSGGYGTSQC
jgi:hypothetical protein